MNDKVKDILRNNLYYVIIAVLSLVVLIVFPFLRSDFEAGWNFPTTSAGWFLFWFEKVTVTGINLAMFTAFKKQGKLNISEHPKYKEAQELMNRVKTKKYEPLSPAKYQLRSYGKKGTTLVITTVATLVAITRMILNFDYLALISYGVTIVMGIIFGIFAMKADEVYWTTDYYFYALQEAETLEELIQKDQEEHRNDL